MRRERVRARAGASMVMVVVMLLVFFVLGGAVLTAASATNAAASARILERQSYYYARSMLDVLDESLQQGKLGAALRGAVMRDLAEHIDEGACTYTEEAPFIMQFTPGFSGDTKSQLTVTGEKNLVVLTCVGTASLTGTVNGDVVAGASIHMKKVELSFVTTYRGIDTYMHVQYRAKCNVSDYNMRTGEGTWDNTWTVQQVG